MKTFLILAIKAVLNFEIQRFVLEYIYWLISASYFATVLFIILSSLAFFLDTIIIIKIESHSCYTINLWLILIIIIYKSLQKSKIVQIAYYETQFARINLQSSQSELTPKHQLITKQICPAVTSPKKQTKRTQDILFRDLLTFRTRYSKSSFFYCF